MQECNSAWCEVEAQSYCANLFAEKDDRKDNFKYFLKILVWGFFALTALGLGGMMYEALFKEEGPDLVKAFLYLCGIGLFIFFTYLVFFK